MAVVGGAVGSGIRIALESRQNRIGSGWTPRGNRVKSASESRQIVRHFCQKRAICALDELVTLVSERKKQPNNSYTTSIYYELYMIGIYYILMGSAL